MEIKPESVCVMLQWSCHMENSFTPSNCQCKLIRIVYICLRTILALFQHEEDPWEVELLRVHLEFNFTANKLHMRETFDPSYMSRTINHSSFHSKIGIITFLYKFPYFHYQAFRIFHLFKNLEITKILY